MTDKEYISKLKLVIFRQKMVINKLIDQNEMLKEKLKKKEKSGPELDFC